MLYGRLSYSSLFAEDLSLERLRKAIVWTPAKHHSVTFGHLEGGFFLDPNLPYTIDDYLYIDTGNNLLVLMSGCIYNQADLRCKYNLNSVTAPSLVAQLYLSQGASFVNELNGDFSIAVYEPDKNAFYLFRDHIGNVPLVYTNTEEALYISSDILGLCRTFYDGGRINMDPLLSDQKTVDMTETPNKKVLKLKPGHFLSHSAVGTIVEKYWKPEAIKTDNTLTQERMFSDIKLLVDDAVHIRSDKRFKAGTHLSGGLDSSTVAAFARKEYSEQLPFYGYSWSPTNVVLDSGDLDERELVKQTCDMAGIEPAFIRVDTSDFVELTQNSFNSFMYYYEDKVLKLAHAHETNLLFSGWGGDEFISNGSMGVDSDLIFNFQWKTFLKKNPISNPKKIAKYLLFRVLIPATNYITSSVINNNLELLRYYKKEFKTIHTKTLKRFYCYRSRRDFQLNMIYMYHLSERTECWYITGYKNGVVYRYPLLDKRIIEYMLKVPSKLLVKDSLYPRIILREITEGMLPESVRWLIAKSSPAIFALVAQQAKERGLLFIDEIEQFRANPNLYFIDFEILSKDIQRYRRDVADSPEAFELFRSLLAFKALHEFTKSYTQPL